MKNQTLVNKFLKVLLVTIYTAISFVIFNRVYEKSKVVIDELFHLGQGMQYCHGNFSAVNFWLFTFAGSMNILFSVILVGSEDYNFSWSLPLVICDSYWVLWHVYIASDSSYLLDHQRVSDLPNQIADFECRQQQEQHWRTPRDHHTRFSPSNVLLCSRLLHRCSVDHDDPLDGPVLPHSTP